MSNKFKISKARLAEIIKEEYQAISEDSDLGRTMGRWAQEANDIPPHLTVARMIEDGNLDGAVEAIQGMRDAQEAASQVEEIPMNMDASVDAMPYNRADTIKKESLDSIRALIAQELIKL